MLLFWWQEMLETTGGEGLVTSVLMESLLLLTPSFFQVKALIQT